MPGLRWTEKEDSLLSSFVPADSDIDAIDWEELVNTHIPRHTSTEASARWASVITSGARKGKWTSQEDSVLTRRVLQDKLESWHEISDKLTEETGAMRTAKQCRERWFNHLDPSLIKGGWTEAEDAALSSAVDKHGTRWIEVAKDLPGRSENAVKNRWNSQFRRGSRSARDKVKGGASGKTASSATRGGKGRSGRGRGRGRKRRRAESVDEEDEEDEQTESEEDRPASESTRGEGSAAGGEEGQNEDMARDTGGIAKAVGEVMVGDGALAGSIAESGAALSTVVVPAPGIAHAATGKRSRLSRASTSSAVAGIEDARLPPAFIGDLKVSEGEGNYAKPRLVTTSRGTSRYGRRQGAGASAGLDLPLPTSTSSTTGSGGDEEDGEDYVQMHMVSSGPNGDGEVNGDGSGGCVAAPSARQMRLRMVTRPDSTGTVARANGVGGGGGRRRTFRTSHPQETDADIDGMDPSPPPPVQYGRSDLYSPFDRTSVPFTDGMTAYAHESMVARAAQQHQEAQIRAGIAPFPAGGGGVTMIGGAYPTSVRLSPYSMYGHPLPSAYSHRGEGGVGVGAGMGMGQGYAYQAGMTPSRGMLVPPAGAYPTDWPVGPGAMGLSPFGIPSPGYRSGYYQPALAMQAPAQAVTGLAPHVMASVEASLGPGAPCALPLPGPPCGSEQSQPGSSSDEEQRAQEVADEAPAGGPPYVDDLDATVHPQPAPGEVKHEALLSSAGMGMGFDGIQEHLMSLPRPLALGPRLVVPPGQVDPLCAEEAAGARTLLSILRTDSPPHAHAQTQAQAEAQEQAAERPGSRHGFRPAHPLPTPPSPVPVAQAGLHTVPAGVGEGGTSASSTPMPPIRGLPVPGGPGLGWPASWAPFASHPVYASTPGTGSGGQGANGTATLLTARKHVTGHDRLGMVLVPTVAAGFEREGGEESEKAHPSRLPTPVMRACAEGDSGSVSTASALPFHAASLHAMTSDL